jgi:hypothetical protein
MGAAEATVAGLERTPRKRGVNAGLGVLRLAGMIAGADSIADMDLLRRGTARAWR